MKIISLIFSWIDILKNLVLYRLMHNVPKWSNTISKSRSKRLQQILQDFESVFDHFETLYVLYGQFKNEKY